MTARRASTSWFAVVGASVGLMMALGSGWAPSLAAAATHKEPADLIVVHGYVVTMNGTKELFEDGAVIVRDRHIAAVGPSAIANRYRAPKTIDAGGDIVMPGMVNAHTHASMTVFRGLGDDVPDRLTRFIFPLEHTLVDREVVYWGACTAWSRWCGAA